jgi:hypothetical protein
MLISSWKSLGSPRLDTSSTLLKSFNGNMFQPHGIITSLPIDSSGKTISFVLEFFDTLLVYNLLLNHTWFYEMIVIISSIFLVLHFPHQGKIITIDHLVFFTPNLGSNVGSNVPFIGDNFQCEMNIDARMFKNTSLRVYLHSPHHLLLQPFPLST